MLLTLLLSTIRNSRRFRQSLWYGIGRMGTLDDEPPALPRWRYRPAKRSAHNRPTGISNIALSMMCPPCHHAPDPMRMIAAAALTSTRRRRLLQLGRPDSYLDHVAHLQPNLGLLRLLALLRCRRCYGRGRSYRSCERDGRAERCVCRQIDIVTCCYRGRRRIGCRVRSSRQSSGEQRWVEGNLTPVKGLIERLMDAQGEDARRAGHVVWRSKIRCDQMRLDTTAGTSFCAAN